MPNSELKNKVYNIPQNMQKYFNLGDTISYSNLKKIKTELNQAKSSNNFDEFNKKGGDQTLNWIENELKTDRDAIYNRKNVGKNAGRENEFIKSHEKDRDNANPTAVGGIPKITKNINRELMTNKSTYNESTKKEINQILYLIEYINKK
jgi:hypothetical protein